jgi:phosphoribosyl-ATP pyrophosphohydrolase
VLWADAGVRPETVWTALETRRGTSGVEEKRGRKPER